MPAAIAAKAAIAGVIVSISIIAALGLAVIENPQVKEWLEEQRQRVAALLAQIGEELDPQSRRAAEAFAFEGRTTTNDQGVRREAAGSQDAAAVATGRSMSTAGTSRRIPIRGPTDPTEAEERRRKGREYLAMREQQMHELQVRRKAAKDAGEATPPTPTFDELVDIDGKLKGASTHADGLPSPPAMEPLPEVVQEQMRLVEHNLSQPFLSESGIAGPSGWQRGSEFANPFGDEYALERSITPKPPAVPPKIELERVASPPISIPGSFDPLSSEQPQPVEAPDTEGLSYEEQLAIALSLSESENATSSATVRQHQPESDDAELRAAIAASLRDMDMDDQQAAHAIAHDDTPAPRHTVHELAETLVDVTSTTPRATSPRPQGEWGHILDRHFPPSHEPWSLAPSEASDELYRLTPELTRARLADHDAQQVLSIASSSPNSTLPFDPVREAARSEENQPGPPAAMEASFYSAPDSPATLGRQSPPHLIDIHEETPHEGMRTPTSRARSGFGFHTDSDTDTFASVTAPASPQRPRSETSGIIEVIDITEDDSDVDMLSEEGDGIATPDSWSEVGSRDADSDDEDDEDGHHSGSHGRIRERS